MFHCVIDKRQQMVMLSAISSSLKTSPVTVGSFTRLVRTMAGPVQEKIKAKLAEAFEPSHLEVLNESYMHSVPKGSETHFKVVVVSNKFESAQLIQRHRMVNKVLKEELASGVHALSIHAKTPAQWEASNTVDKSPNCMGGSKHDKK
eukprot:Colp12_sorted_trinity150504_noHs@32461